MSAFENAAKAIKESGKEEGMQKISDDEQLKLYALFKQANFGDSEDKNKPGMFNFKEKAKFASWT
jgi:acyl-CoA-binding protein